MSDKRETKQKKAIALEVSKTKSIFTTESIYEKIRKQNSKIGIATVYRSLKELEKERSIHAFKCDRKTLYSKSEMDHNHFKCEVCRSIKHIKINKIDFIKELPDEEICHIQIELNGICKNCKQKLDKYIN